MQYLDVLEKALFLDLDYFKDNYVPISLKDIEKEFKINIDEKEEYYFVDLSPLSGEGHDFQFEINKKTGKIDKSSLVIGEVLPEEQNY